MQTWEDEFQIFQSTANYSVTSLRIRLLRQNELLDLTAIWTRDDPRRSRVPLLVIDITQLESVKRVFKKRLISCAGQSYSEMLTNLGTWTAPSSCWFGSCYKILHGMIKLNIDNLFVLKPSTLTHRSLLKIAGRTDGRMDGWKEEVWVQRSVLV